MPRWLETTDPDFAQSFAAIVQDRRETPDDVADVVRSILADVRARGDDAVFDYTARFDRIALSPETVRVSDAEIAAAVDACPADTRDALALAAARIRAFHSQLRPGDHETTDDLGVRAGVRWTPIEAVGLYVPGGRAAYPSSVLMNAIPAIVAGVSRLAMTVPAPDGLLNPLVLAAAQLAGVQEIYRIGGAQAIAALAFGTRTIPAVDKIVGPGNAYVAEAKRQVFGVVGIDMVAGPSEILVLADVRNDPAHIAADLLSQAEHDPVAQAILVTDDAGFGRAVMAKVKAHLARWPDDSSARQSWERYGVVIVVRNLAEAVPLIDALAAEHLELAIAEPEELRLQIRHAGSIFLGRHTPEAIGDYLGGPNHVLPTGRRARFASGLSVSDFMKRTTYLECPPEALATLGPATVTLAQAEGLPAHALSVSLRRNSVLPD